MSRPLRPTLWMLIVALASGGLACGNSAVSGPGDEQQGNGDRAPTTDAGAFVLPDAPAAAEDRPSGPCVPLTCTPLGGNYCGSVGDGCGGVLTCPATCPDGLTCGGGGAAGVCGKPVDPSCVPISCKQPGGQLCGRVGDGCGRALECGVCAGGGVCGASIPNVCRARAAPPPSPATTSASAR